MIKPLRNLVLVEPLIKEKSASGIVLANAQGVREALVIEAGKDAKDFTTGDKCVLKKECWHQEVKDDGNKYWLVDDSSLLAIL